MSDYYICTKDLKILKAVSDILIKLLDFDVKFLLKFLWELDFFVKMIANDNSKDYRK